VIRRALTALLAAASVMRVAGCGRGDLTGPPELRLGRDQCAECGMLISDDRFAAAALVERRGVREHDLYDDIGCLLDHGRRGQDGGRVVERFVRDAGTREWIAAADAIFVLADPDRLRTPMGSGIAAYSSRARAEAARGQASGALLNFDSLSAQAGAPAPPGPS
jgi:copper chaperone NosL